MKNFSKRGKVKKFSEEDVESKTGLKIEIWRDLLIRVKLEVILFTWTFQITEFFLSVLIQLRVR